MTMIDIPGSEITAYRADPPDAARGALIVIHEIWGLVDYLQTQPGVDGRIAVTGFCFGGSYSFALAAADPRIRAAVPFYGSPPDSANVSAITGPVLAFYGDLDENLMASLPTVTRAMTDAGVDFQPTVYSGARHAFFNDTNSMTYTADAAADAWQRTLAFLEQQLA